MTSNKDDPQLRRRSMFWWRTRVCSTALNRTQYLSHSRARTYRSATHRSVRRASSPNTHTSRTSQSNRHLVRNHSESSRKTITARRKLQSWFKRTSGPTNAEKTTDWPVEALRKGSLSSRWRSKATTVPRRWHARSNRSEAICKLCYSTSVAREVRQVRLKSIWHTTTTSTPTTWRVEW